MTSSFSVLYKLKQQFTFPLPEKTKKVLDFFSILCYHIAVAKDSRCREA